MFLSQLADRQGIRESEPEDSWLRRSVVVKQCRHLERKALLSEASDDSEDAQSGIPNEP
jgi:hypothetical protein